MTVVTIDVSAESADSLDEQLVGQLARRARAKGVTLTGEGGLLPGGDRRAAGSGVLSPRRAPWLAP